MNEKIIYTKKIWEVLSGDSSVKFSRADSKIKIAIENSLNKMMNMKISIEDPSAKDENNRHVSTITGPFLPIEPRATNELGFNYKDTPPLYRYAEMINGEFIKVPVYLLAPHLHKENEFKPKNLWVDENGNKTISWKATIENTVLCHYLLHRIFISRTNRLTQMRFDVIRKILCDSLKKECLAEVHDLNFFNRKVLSILCYYQRISLTDFSGYITNKTSSSNDSFTEITEISDFTEESDFVTPDNENHYDILLPSDIPKSKTFTYRKDHEFFILPADNFPREKKQYLYDLINIINKNIETLENEPALSRLETELDAKKNDLAAKEMAYQLQLEENSKQIPERLTLFDGVEFYKK